MLSRQYGCPITYKTCHFILKTPNTFISRVNNELGLVN